MHRRTFLATAASALSTAAAGHAAAADGAPAPAATGVPAPYESSVVRAEGEADVSTRTEEDREHVSYLEEDDEVRYVEAWMSTHSEDGGPPEREPLYTTRPWTDFAETRATSAAATAAAEHTRAQLDREGLHATGALSSRVPGADSGALVVVTDAEADDEPRIGIEEAAAATPATVDATYELDGQTYEAAVPVYVTVEAPPEPLRGNGTAGDEMQITPASVEDEGSDGDGNETESEAEDGDDELPGFGVVAAVAGFLGAVAGTSVRRRLD